jgi:hypothetical protein
VSILSSKDIGITQPSQLNPRLELVAIDILRHRPDMSKTVLITGATGKQGGSVVDALLSAKADFEILAVTRDASSGGAQKLQKKSSNIKLVEGNLDEPEKIFTNARKATSEPIWGVFSVQVSGLRLQPSFRVNN